MQHGSWIWAVVGCIAVCFCAAGIGGAFTARAVGEWYGTLAKPSWTPPSWLFGPAWTVLYTMMGVALALVWMRRGEPGAALGITLFGVQLVLNVLWSVIFFGMRSPAWGMVDITVLWLAILGTMVVFFKVTPAAGWLFVPYLVWVTFASALNFAIWRLNL